VVSKSFCGRIHDKSIYDKTKAYADKRIKKKADLGYKGTEIITPIKKPRGIELTPNQKQFNRELSKERIVIEHSIGKMKIFKILSNRFRNPISSHMLIFKNIAGLTNMMYYET